MKKYIVNIASLLLIMATTMLSGANGNNQVRNAPNCQTKCTYAPTCPSDCAQCGDPCDPCKPNCTVCPTPCNEPLCTPITRCRYPNSCEVKCRDGLIVRCANPKTCMLGDQYPLEFEIRACEDVCEVVVNCQLPEGVTYMRSTPEAKVEGNMLTWDIGPMKCGQCIPAKVLIKCECEGELCACFCAKATPVRFCSLLCAKPRLVCQKCGPAKACPGDRLTYRVTITNRGSCAAENVVLTDNIPEGLEHSSGQKTVCYNFGNLAPCESKCVDINLCAVKRGNVCNTAVVTACNADSVSCQACTTISCCDVKITKTGPKEQGLGKNADYQITVTNPGDVSLTNVVVTDCAASATSIVTANGATIRGNQAVWKLKELKAGEKVTFGITLTTCTPGCFTNRSTVNTCEGCNGCAEVTTRWKGRPAIHFCVTATEDPICINDPTSFNVQLQNQGPEPDSNVKIVVRFPKEIQPLGINGDLKGAISGQTVTFQPTGTLWPRQTINVRIDAKGKESGEGRVTAEVTSDSVTTPITQQESIQVY
jgi:uncharacterized repeat protein (TIGR01451 family)